MKLSKEHSLLLGQYKENLKQLIRPILSNHVWRNKLFLATVVVPTALSILYFGPIASDVYITESKFVVKSTGQNSAPSLDGLLGRMGVSSSNNDAWGVQSYSLSRDALSKLDKDLQVKQHYSSNVVDVFNRFPTVRIWDSSFEWFHDYYLGKVAVLVDPITSVNTLTVRAYNPEMALKINQSLLSLSEDLVNQLNLRARQDLMKSAQREVDIAKSKIQDLSKEISLLRKKEGVKDPDEQVIRLQNLHLEREFADKQLATSLSSLEQARTEALKKQLYIERVANPILPDSAMEPRRIRGIISTLLLGLVLWGILSLLISGVKEHHA
jgi:capsular polysaccharide transport system permease protein